MPGPQKDAFLKMLEEPKNNDKEGLFNYFYESFMMIGSPEKDEEVLKTRIREGINRCLCPDGGTKRQFAAILNNGSRVNL